MNSILAIAGGVFPVDVHARQWLYAAWILSFTKTTKNVSFTKKLKKHCLTNIASFTTEEKYPIQWLKLNLIDGSWKCALC